VASGKVKVPDVVGLDRGDATQALSDQNLKYTTNFRNSDQPEGTVLSQTHRNGIVDVGTRIVLVIAQAAPPTVPPTTPATTATGTATTAP